MAELDDRLDAAGADAYLAATLALARPQALSPTWLSPCLEALARALTEAPGLLAPLLAIDLVPLLGGERLQPLVGELPAGLRAAARAWEDEVLARLLADARWSRLVDAVSGLPPARRPVAAALVAVRVHQSLGLPAGPGIAPSAARRLATRGLPEVREAARSALAEAGTARLLETALRQAAQGARRQRSLLHEAEVMLAEHVAVLERLGPRVALAQVADAAEQLDLAVPAWPRSPSRDDGSAPTALEEESAYPVGGFSSVTTRGALENLITSELAYMEPAGGDGPDLFDVRYAENELLYFARDEGLALRRRRAVVLVLDASLVQARVLDEGEAAQRLSWALGAVVVLARRLARWLSAEALAVDVVFAGPLPGLEEERELLGLVLRPEVERGVVSLLVAGATAGAVREAQSRHAGLARVLVWGAAMPGGLEGDASPEAWVDLSRPAPRVHWLHGAAVEVPGEGALPGWTGALLDVVNGVLRPRRRWQGRPGPSR